MISFHLLFVVLTLATISRSNGSQIRDVQDQSFTDMIRTFELNVTLGVINPDCSSFDAPVLLVNEQLPGPTIRVRQGERLRVIVRNQLPKLNTTIVSHGGDAHDVAIHFHGIRQYGSVHADGVPFLTQLPVKPGEEYVHDFRIVNQAGTYFYHAHVGLQEQTVFGPLIVDEEESENLRMLDYDEERVLTLSEWWHRDRLSFERHLMGPDFDVIPEADSILLNGQTLHDPDHLTAKGCNGYTTLDVEPGKTYRLRIIGATTFRTLGLAIAHHNMTIVEVDGELVKPFRTDFLEVAPGQRFSVLLYTHQSALEESSGSRDFAIGTIRRWADGDVNPESNGIGVLRYRESSPVNETKTSHRGKLEVQVGLEESTVVLRAPRPTPHFPSSEHPFWIWSRLAPAYGVDPVVHKPASRTIMLRATDRRMADGRVRWFINDVSFEEPKSPILTQLQQSGRRSGRNSTTEKTAYDPYLGTYPIQYYEIVDLVLQSTHIPGQPCRSHPWHTHGHSHWEIANGRGEYDEARDAMIRNMPSPIHKDVTMVYPYPDPRAEMVNGTLGTKPVGCGWSKIRIIADNPGIWAVHCHNTPHMMMGMMVALEEAVEMIPRYPALTTLTDANVTSRSS